MAASIPVADKSVEKIIESKKEEEDVEYVDFKDMTPAEKKEELEHIKHHIEEMGEEMGC